MVKGQKWAAFFMTVAAAACGVFGGPIVGGWTMNTDASGGVASMTLTNPRTYLNIEQTIDITVDYQGTLMKGTVKFRNGVQKDLNAPQEVQFFWDEYKGAHALWEYFASMNRVELFNPDETVIPPMMYGRNTRVISKAGNEYFGKLMELPSNPDWFKLEIAGNVIVIYRHAIAVIQQLK